MPTCNEMAPGPECSRCGTDGLSKVSESIAPLVVMQHSVGEFANPDTIKDNVDDCLWVHWELGIVISS